MRRRPRHCRGAGQGFGNGTRDEYCRLEDDILWEVMKKDTHALKTVLKQHAGQRGLASKS
ncbi:MAG TPA: hypothetical protein VFY92_04785 [Hyphomicrobiaceae bacterium]|nr:hypothetical protein [Hyphomicrobiaceae bacterium]